MTGADLADLCIFGIATGLGLAAVGGLAIFGHRIRRANRVIDTALAALTPADAPNPPMTLADLERLGRPVDGDALARTWRAAS